jgi:dTMP kinase
MTDSDRFRLAPGTIAVLEGLDRTGKSTQLERLKEKFAGDRVAFAHMPSGLTGFSRSVYEVLESSAVHPTSGLAKQLAHLACHAENMPTLVDALTDGSLVLDRCWWSTVVYGWCAGSVPDSGMSEDTFRHIIATVWAPVTPTIVFLFLHPLQDDDNNDPAVTEGYRLLANEHPSLTVLVPSGSIQDTERFILAELRRRGLVTEMSSPT